jgi:transposase
MTVTVDNRRAHQLQVAALLEELEERRRHLHRLKAGGARMAGLRDVKSDLEDARLRLLDAVT